ncbi:MAG: hypothetical protein ACKOGC_02030 [Anaerolineae bacterium]
MKVSFQGEPGGAGFTWEGYFHNDSLWGKSVVVNGSGRLESGDWRLT